MNKKELKWYEAPAQEVMECKYQGILCESSNVPDVNTEEPGEEY